MSTSPSDVDYETSISDQFDDQQKFEEGIGKPIDIRIMEWSKRESN
jgi:hypothetical protein